MKLKLEYNDTLINDPFGPGQNMYMKFVDPALYPYLYKIGYDYMFDIEKVEVEPKTKTIKTKKN